LGKIPANRFVGISAAQDRNLELAGMIVYNTKATTGIGVHVWDGDDWIKPCAPPALGPITFSDITICGSGATFTAKINSVNGATGYVWELPDGLSGSSNDTIITIGWTTEGVYSAGSITVRAESSCGAGTQSVAVGAIPAKPTGTGIATSVGNNFTFSASVPVDHEIYWYTTETSGSPISDKIGKPSFTEPLTTTLLCRIAQ
jgi:hypothetical protein